MKKNDNIDDLINRYMRIKRKKFLRKFKIKPLIKK